MTKADVLELLSALPDDAQVTLSVAKRDLEEALLARGGGNPNRIVNTAWCSKNLGMSQEWWSSHAEHIEGAFQEKPGKPWYLPVGAARQYLSGYQADRASTRKPRRKRGPWKARTP